MGYKPGMGGSDGGGSESTAGEILPFQFRMTNLIS